MEKERRLHQLPEKDIKDVMSHTVLVENLPEDHSTENIQHIFGGVGAVLKLIFLSVQLHALVEYDTVEAVQKAVGTLNNEKIGEVACGLSLF
ncbi:hypothetical protein H6P81_017936 [Aristolochia fimbriata]|uniref:RRM domain-containing protein n=1 Tax=Aristolochia fimbriata TaxID=158543 RepID=A0AAV7E2M6_ARIFI|nr:hypothetical protein H6P81_017936 [Aristolochia fimbriata]